MKRSFVVYLIFILYVININDCNAQNNPLKWEGNIELLNFFKKGESRRYNIKYLLNKQNYLRATILSSFKNDFRNKNTNNQFDFDFDFQIGLEKRFSIYKKVSLYTGILGGVKLSIVNVDEITLANTPSGTQVTNIRQKFVTPDLVGVWGVTYSPTKRIALSVETQAGLKYDLYQDKYYNYTVFKVLTFNFIPVSGFFVGYRF